MSLNFIMNNFRPSRFSRFAFGVSYIGPHFQGWTSSPASELTSFGMSKVISGINPWDYLPSIEHALFSLFAQTLGISNFTSIRGSSRTDRGVHALRNTFQIDVSEDFISQTSTSKEEFALSLRNRINQLIQGTYYQESPSFFELPLNPTDFYLSPSYLKFFSKYPFPSIYLTDVECMDQYPTFDIRQSAIGRSYVYKIHVLKSVARSSSSNLDSSTNVVVSDRFRSGREWQMIQSEWLNVEAMREAASYLVGMKDFAPFQSSGCLSVSTVREIQHINISSLLLSPPLSSSLLLSPPPVINNNTLTSSSNHSHIPSSSSSSSSFSSFPFSPSSSYTSSSSDISDLNSSHYSRHFPQARPCQLISISFSANAFLRKMVRNIVGVLVQVGQGRLSPSDLAPHFPPLSSSLPSSSSLSSSPSLPSHSSPPPPPSSPPIKFTSSPAPAHGLYLENVYYSLSR